MLFVDIVLKPLSRVSQCEKSYRRRYPRMLFIRMVPPTGCRTPVRRNKRIPLKHSIKSLGTFSKTDNRGSQLSYTSGSADELLCTAGSVHWDGSGSLLFDEVA